ncbi:hypothetical protein V6R21_23440 [Limibacter armeniacum]|uniref:hypothetical protein n=1 Tax=Limibacter armeniacum TaxID=466084 RepID=UPI002FE607C2
MTGIDNVFYSNIPFNNIIEEFEGHIREYWTSYIVDKNVFHNSNENIEKHERFYSKDENMLTEHDEYGFNSRINKQGCIYFIAVRKKHIDLKVNIIEEVNSNVEPYESQILLNDAWQYTLVTPEEIDKEGFSQEIFRKLIDCFK